MLLVFMNIISSAVAYGFLTFPACLTQTIGAAIDGVRLLQVLAGVLSSYFVTWVTAG